MKTPQIEAMAGMTPLGIKPQTPATAKNEKPFRGAKVGVYWHGGGWYCAGYAADGVSHYQQTGTLSLAAANAEAEAIEAGLDPYPQD